MIISKQPLHLVESLGMDNLNKVTPINPEKSGYFPHIVLNMEHHSDKFLRKRKGYTKIIDWQDCHSVWGYRGYLFFCGKSTTAAEAIYRYHIETQQLTKVTDVMGRMFPMYYVGIDDTIFWSSKVSNGVYHLGLDVVEPWDRSTPESILDIDSMTDSDPLLNLGSMGVPPLEFLCWHSSRIYGADGSDLVYTEAFDYYTTKPYNRIKFPEEITMLAPIQGGLYVASANNTWFLDGTSPTEFKQVLVGRGAVRGTLSYGVMINPDSFRERHPFWINSQGVCCGKGGKEINLTSDKLLIPIGSVGAGVIDHSTETPSYKVTLKNTTPTGRVGDKITMEVFRNGKLV